MYNVKMNKMLSLMMTKNFRGPTNKLTKCINKLIQTLENTVFSHELNGLVQLHFYQMIILGVINYLQHFLLQ